jgi:hypothetical protein
MKYGIVYILAVLTVAFAVSSLAMWVFASWLGLNPVVVAGFIGVGYASNRFFNPPHR